MLLLNNHHGYLSAIIRYLLCSIQSLDESLLWSMIHLLWGMLCRSVDIRVGANFVFRAAPTEAVGSGVLHKDFPLKVKNAIEVIPSSPWSFSIMGFILLEVKLPLAPQTMLSKVNGCSLGGQGSVTDRYVRRHGSGVTKNCRQSVIQNFLKPIGADAQNW